MPTQDDSPSQQFTSHQYKMTVDVFGPIRIALDLHQDTHRAIKGHNSGRDFHTEITLHASRNGGMRVEYTVTAKSPAGAERAGVVYLSQLCDLLSVVTRSPIWFYLLEEDARDERIRMHRRVSAVDRILTKSEWLWITGNLVYLRRAHPRFLAAASWYRKAMTGSDNLDNFCCFWRVIERLALSFADKSNWASEKRAKSNVKDCVLQLLQDLKVDSTDVAILTDPKYVADIIQLRNDLSHGNIPITPDVIDGATSFLKPLEGAAFRVLQELKDKCLVCESP